MERRLQGKVAVVTGAGKGIGRAVALALAAEGCDVVVTARTESDLVSLGREIEALGCQVCDWRGRTDAAGPANHNARSARREWREVENAFGDRCLEPDAEALRNQ